MTLDEQITRSLAARADRAPYDATPLSAVVHDAHGIRRRRRAAAGLGVAVVVAAVVVPLGVVRAVSDDGAGPVPAATSPAATGVAPLGYLSDGVYHRSSGGRVAIDLGSPPAAVAEIGDDVWVLADDYSTLTRVDAAGEAHAEGCSTGVPRTSPSGDVVARVDGPCSGATGSSTISVTGPSGEVDRPVAVDAPYLLGVVDDGTVVYGDGGRPDRPDTVHVLHPDGTEGTLPGGLPAVNVHYFDPVHQLLLISRPEAPELHAGAAVSLHGDVPWSLDHTSVEAPSPDGRHVLVTRVPRRTMAYPPTPGGPLVQPRVLDLLTGETVAALPERTPDGALLTGYLWDDDQHLLAEAFDGDRRRIVRVALDGTVTEPYPDLTDPDFDVRAGPGVVFQTR